MATIGIMDSGWAVVLGAAIAFLGSVGGKALQDWLSDRRNRVLAQREERREAVRGVIALTLEQQRAHVSGTPMTADLLDRQLASASELALVAEKGGSEAGAFVLAQWRAIRDASNQKEVATAAGRLVNAITAWHRGELNSKELASRTTT